MQVDTSPDFLVAYRSHEAMRAEEGLTALPLNEQQAGQLVELLKNPPAGESEFLLYLLTECVPPGVDKASYVKAAFLNAIAIGEAQSPLLTKARATELLATMLGGYNIQPLIHLLDDAELAPIAAKGLEQTLLMFDAFHDVATRAKDNVFAKQVLESWAAAKWFTDRPKVAEKLTLTVFKVPGETNTDDLSPGMDAWSRPDIPLHAKAMLKIKQPGSPEKITELKEKEHPIVYVGDVVGTGSSRKSAINSLLWYIGNDIPYTPNKRSGGVVLGSKIAPIFFNSAEDAGALPIEVDVSALTMGDVIHLYPYEGKMTDADDNVLATFQLRPLTLLDEIRAGGRINLIIGRELTDRARATLGLPVSDVFLRPTLAAESAEGFTLAQKMVGKACGVKGIRPGTYCEPRMTTVGSQDTTGPMTRDELKDLACLGFTADLVMQSFCHTAAYPKPVDIEVQHSLPEFMASRGGVALRPGDGIIHSWLNRMLLPDTVGTGGDSHTRFPIGISFPGGSGVVAFGAALGVMPLDMPESVLVRFSGEMQPGITLRDLVNAIPYVAIQRGLLTVEKHNKQNVFSGRVLEIEGLPHLKVEQAFELADASAERSANGCTVRLDKAPIIEYLQSNIALLRWMIANDYHDARTLQRRIEAMEAWLADPVLLEPDANATYAEIIDIDLTTITEPLLACPNDPDNIKPLSVVANDPVHEVFIGSCMTNIGHYRAAGKLLKDYGKQVPTVLWVVPPTKMDAHQLTEEGFYSVFGLAGARVEIPGCSLCMGNQARVRDNATVVSTSTRNFPGRLGNNANVYLCSAELAAITSIFGRLPTVAEYMEKVADINIMAADIYRYLNFDQLPAFQLK